MMKPDSKHLAGSTSRFRTTKVLFSMLCLLISSALFAQQTVKGKVTSVDGVLNNVTVTVKGTTNSTQTNTSGEYSISAGPDDVLVFTSVGFNVQEIPVNSQATVDVKMSASSQMMTDVVVVGYGTQ